MRYYSSIAVDTAITIPVGSSDTSITVGGIVGYPTEFPFTIVLDPDTANEELVEVTDYAGSTFTVTRGFDSTTPVSHAVGAKVKHVASAADFTESQQHIAATENVHGIADTAFLVTTNGSQTLTNKTLQSPAITGTPTISLVDAKGDLIVGTANDTIARFPVGSNNQVLTADSSKSSGLKWASPAGSVIWTQRANLSSSPVDRIAYNGTDLYVAISGSTLATSPDGITWTEQAPGFGGNRILGIAYGNGLWVAVGAQGLISTSTDGVTWTARTANVSTNDLYDVVYANSLWVAVGDGANNGNGGITTSSNGINWTKQTTPGTNNPTVLLTIAYGSGYWVTGGYNPTGTGSSPSIYYSSNGTSWTAGVFNGIAGNLSTVHKLFYNSGTWYAFYFSRGSYTAGSVTSSDQTPPTSYTTYSFSDNSLIPTVGSYSNFVSNPPGWNTFNGLHSFYDGNFYVAGNAYSTGEGVYGANDIVKFSVVFDGNVKVDHTVYATIPTRYVFYTSYYFTRYSQASAANSIYVGPNGVIIGGSGGEIWTSF